MSTKYSPISNSLNCCDSVDIYLIFPVINGLEELAADVENTYLTYPYPENVWTCAGLEFGHSQGKVFILERARRLNLFSGNIPSVLG